MEQMTEIPENKSNVESPKKLARQMRRVRIAASVFFALVAVAFAVLWVRSHYYVSDLTIPLGNSNGLFVHSLRGDISVFFLGNRGMPYSSRWGTEKVDELIVWEYESMNLIVAEQTAATGGKAFRFSAWMPVAASVLLLVALCVPFSRRFSLRTLLIATTLIAVVLGLAVWVGR